MTWGMMFSQLTAIALGALVVTSEYGRGMIRATVAAVPPPRGVVLEAKPLVLSRCAVRSRPGHRGSWATSVATCSSTPRASGWRSRDDGMLRALLGNGLYLAGLGLFAPRPGTAHPAHRRGAHPSALALVLVLGNLAYVLPGTWGEWVGQADAGQRRPGTVAQAVPFDGGAALQPLDRVRGVRGRDGRRARRRVFYLVFRRRDA